MGRMTDDYVPDWAERIQEELKRYDRRSMVGDTVMDQLPYIASKLRMVRMGGGRSGRMTSWRTWIVVGKMGRRSTSS